MIFSCVFDVFTLRILRVPSWSLWEDFGVLLGLFRNPLVTCGVPLDTFGDLLG